MNDFIALDTCLLCNKDIEVAINRNMKPIEHGPHSLSLCDECKQNLKNNNQILVVECMLDTKGKIKGITGRVAYTNEKLLSPEAPMYDVVMKGRVLLVSEEIFNKMLEVKDSHGKKHSEIFKQFTGTEHYYPVGKYAYTDGIHYLQQKLNNNKVFFEFFELVSNLLNFKNLFLSIDVTIEKDNFNIHVTNGNYKKLGDFSIKLDKENKELEGTYNIFMYNYVMLAASEY